MILAQCEKTDADCYCLASTFEHQYTSKIIIDGLGFVFPPGLTQPLLVQNLGVT